jgi:hypothetical protein
MRAIPSLRQLVSESCAPISNVTVDTNDRSRALVDLAARLAGRTAEAADEIVHRQLVPQLVGTLKALNLLTQTNTFETLHRLGQCLALVVMHASKQLQQEHLFRRDAGIDVTLMNTIYTIARATRSDELDTSLIRITTALARMAVWMGGATVRESARRGEIISSLASMSVLAPNNTRLLHTIDLYLRAVCKNAPLPDLDAVQVTPINLAHLHILRSVTHIAICAVDAMPKPFAQQQAAGGLLGELLLTGTLGMASCHTWVLDGLAASLSWANHGTTFTVLGTLRIVQRMAIASRQHQQLISTHDGLAKAISDACTASDTKVRAAALSLWRTLLARSVSPLDLHMADEKVENVNTSSPPTATTSVLLSCC